MVVKRANIRERPAKIVRNARGTFWVAPRAIVADSEGDLWIRLDHKYSDDQPGQDSVKVRHLQSGEYVVDNLDDQEWTPVLAPNVSTDFYAPVFTTDE